LFNWNKLAPNHLWTKTNTINQYSPYGFELENEDALGIKSSALYGYDNTVVTAVASNTAYKELAFDGFEDYNGSYTTSGTNNGHLTLSNAVLTDEEAHTGDYSMLITSKTNPVTLNTRVSSSLQNAQFTPEYNPGGSNDYYVSAWVKSLGTASASLTLVSGTTSQTISTSSSTQKIEGWQRLEGKLTTTWLGDAVAITIEANNGVVYLDDIRIQPYLSTMKTYVYDPKTLWLKAELDNRNYATIYNYDEEGNLVQIKKETKNGMKTIVSNRKNVKKNSIKATP
jgi:hypothetical protein